MATNTHSASDQLNSNQQSRFFSLDPYEYFLFLLIGTFLLMAFNAKEIWRFFTNNVLSLGSGVSLSNNSPTWNHILNIATQSRIPLILFWFTVGLLIYILIWFLRNIYLNVRNDFVVDSYVHPKDYSKQRFWEAALARKALFVFSVFILFSYVLFFFRLVRILAKECYDLVINFQPSHSAIFLILTGLATGFLIYILVILVRTVGRCWRSIDNDF